MKVNSYLVLDECIQEEKKAISFQFIYRLHGEKTEHKINLKCCFRCRLSQSPFPLVSAGLVERSRLGPSLLAFARFTIVPRAFSSHAVDLWQVSFM